MSLYGTLARTDLRNIRRDPLLAWVILLPLALAFLYRLTPLLRDALLARFAFDLQPYYPLIASSFITSAPGIAGMVIGFLLLDERDDGILLAVAVTPVQPRAYVAYRIAAPLLAGFLITIIAWPILGFLPLPLADVLAISAVSASIGPFTALFLAVFAQNKVAGFAMVKVLNAIGIAPVAVWFLEERWQWIGGISPSYWAMKMLWLAADGRPIATHAALGVLVPGLMIAALVARFRRRMARPAGL